MAMTCSRCGAKQGVLSIFSVDVGGAPFLCPACEGIVAKEKHDREADALKMERDRIAKIRQAAAKVIVTTTPKVDGTQVVAYLGIESVEFVIGTGVFSEVSSSISDFFGARSSAFEQKLRAAKTHALDALKYIAAEKGANAVIGIDLDYTEFTGNRIALIINGTLVKLAPTSGKVPVAAKKADSEI
jgi:uncharacterized protein YbjQ (UPF0145 family)